MEQQKGFIGMIFDTSFSEFVTTRVIKVLLVLAMIVNALFVLAMIIFNFANQGFLVGLLVLILSPLIYLIMMLVSRIYLEILIVIFRIADELRSIRIAQGGAEPEKFEE